MITGLRLKHFTAFQDLDINFSPKINVIIGENGTGKTHLLKAAYGLCTSGAVVKNNTDVSAKELATVLTDKLLRLFMPLENKLGKLRRHGVTGNTEIEARFNPDRKLIVSFSSRSKTLAIQKSTEYKQYQAEPVYIPTKEVLSLVQGMNHEQHDQRTVELIFDDSYVDLSELLINPGYEDPKTKIDLDPRFGSIVPKLVNLIGGKYHWENGGFCFQQGTYEEKPDPGRSNAKHARMYQDSVVTRFTPTNDPKYASSMTAEGFKKIGMLHRLLINGSLNPGTSGPLFWDEPESNLNPKLMKLLVQVLLELSRNGQQIILATHDYVLLKWFDLLMDKGKDDHVQFHSLYRDPDTSEIRITSTDNYLKITPNPIDDAFGYLINQEIENDMGGLGK